MGFFTLGFGRVGVRPVMLTRLGLRLVRLGGANFLGLGLVGFLLIGFGGSFRFATQHIFHGSGFEFGGGNDFAFIRRFDLFDGFGSGFLALAGLAWGTLRVAHVGLRNGFKILPQRRAGGNGFAGDGEQEWTWRLLLRGRVFSFRVRGLCVPAPLPRELELLLAGNGLAIKPVLQPLAELEVGQE
jgi:hypothetical protein